jgi:hypothetical protein
MADSPIPRRENNLPEEPDTRGDGPQLLLTDEGVQVHAVLLPDGRVVAPDAGTEIIAPGAT